MLIGTSGFDYPHWRGPFYPSKLPVRDRLGFYAQHFGAVELNVTFYRMPAAESFRRWAAAVPDGFEFAVKASRYITHVRRLKDPRHPVEFLMERAGLLGSHLGPVLLQLPPDMAADPERLGVALEAFGRTRVAVEFRNPGWYTDEVEALLRRHSAALCLTDRRGPRTPLWKTAGWVYVRFHEGRSRPLPCYGDRALRAWVTRLEGDGGRDGPNGGVRPNHGATPGGYAFFNNDAGACAVRNAERFRRLLARSEP